VDWNICVYHKLSDTNYPWQSHICVLQSTLDLLESGRDVHVLADGVSSCNREEVPYALARMRQAGAHITTSESMAFQLQSELFFVLRVIGTITDIWIQVDANMPSFKAFAAIIKDEKNTTTNTLENLLSQNVTPDTL